jgi:hypothetical protein
MEAVRMKYEHVDHTLAIGDVYFTLQPSHFMFEPVERFSYPGSRKEPVFNPDCIFVHQRKVYVCEVQRKDRSKKEWMAKWDTFNKFFEEAFTQAEYQKWSNKGNILPQFVVITTNKYAAEGFNIPHRELKVISSITELL